MALSYTLDPRELVLFLLEDDADVDDVLKNIAMGRPHDWGCRLCGLPLDYGVERDPSPDPLAHAACVKMVTPSPSNWHSISQANLAEPFGKVAALKGYQTDAEFWDGPNAVRYANPERWLGIADAERAIFFARKHSGKVVLSDNETRVLEGAHDLSGMMKRPGVYPHYVLEFGIMLRQLGADSYTILKPFIKYTP